jgi:peptidyl-prolyl cis-trans isomerase C
MRSVIIRLTAILAVICFINGCGGGEKEGEGSDIPSESTGEVESSAVVAVVEGEEITEGELSERVNEMKMSMGGRMNPAEMAQMEESFRNQAFSSLVNYNLLINEAEEQGISVPDSEVQNRTEDIIESYQSEEQFNQRIKEMGLDRETFRERLTEQIRIDKLIEKETESLEGPSGEEIRDYYDSNPGQFEQPDQVRASHILIKVEETDDEETREEKREKLEGILQDIRAGASFSEQASLYSEGPSKSKGGDLGFFKRGDMVKPFSDAAFEMEVGEVSDIVETRYGYHIIKVTDRKQARTVPFAEVEERIADYLQNTGKNEAINSYLTELREKADIQYYDSSLVQKSPPE